MRLKNKHIWRKRFDFYTDKPGECPHVCDHPDCVEPGRHKAPKSPSDIRADNQKFYNLCRQHAGEYNRKWNYCDGMSKDDIDRMWADRSTWSRKTWANGFDPMREANLRRRAASAMNGDAFADWFEKRTAGRESSDFALSDCTTVATALKVFGLQSVEADAAIIKKRFRILGKKFHPDVNGSSQESEERFKIINQAYMVLKGHYSI